MHCGDPSLRQMLNEPIVRLLMNSYNVSDTELLQLGEDVRRRLEGHEMADSDERARRGALQDQRPLS